MKCKACWRDCAPPKFVAFVGVVVTPTYCEQVHGGVQRTANEWWNSGQETFQTMAQANKPKAQAMANGQGLSQFRNPEKDEELRAKARKKRAEKETARAAARKARGPKKKKGDKKDKNKKKGKGGKGGKEDKNKKAGKGDKGARRAAAQAAQYGGGGGSGLLTAVSSSKAAPATTPATTPAKTPTP